METGPAEDMPVGVVGLGSMGLCLAERLLDRARRVVGYDPAPRAIQAFVASGGRQAESVAALAGQCRLLLLALPTVDSFRTVVAELAATPGQGWVLDINTLLPEEKFEARDQLAAAGWTAIDCSVSGTPEMVVRDQHSIYYAGEGKDEEPPAALFRQLAVRLFDMGDFGNAARIKLIINHMVIAHNVVAAEAMSLAIHAGLDPELAYDTIAASAGSSRIFELRGRMMVSEDYPEAAMYALIVDKDATLIAELARTLRHPVPMLATAVQQHVLGMAQGWADCDPASLCSMMERQAGVERTSRG